MSSNRPDDKEPKGPPKETPPPDVPKGPPEPQPEPADGEPTGPGKGGG